MSESEGEFERRHKRKQRRLALIAIAAVLVPAGWLTAETLRANRERDAARLTAAQKAELTAALDTREAAAKQTIADWNAAARAEVAAGVAFGDGGCPVEISPPPQLSAAAYVRYATHDVAFGKWTLCVLRDAGVCDATFVADEAIARLRTRIQEDDVYTWDLQATKSDPIADSERVLVVPETETPPDVHSAVVGKVNFTPGALTARALVFLPAAHTFVCGTTVSVRNSRTVDIEYPHFDEGPEEQRKMAEAETKAALERDLEMHLRYAVSKGARAVAP